jgi:hypothetical protein
MKTLVEIEKFFEAQKLYCGRMISANKKSKEGAYYNANIFTEGHGKVWYGDIDTIKDKFKLQTVADFIGKPIYILREMDGRFENQYRPIEEVVKVAVATINPE